MTKQKTVAPEITVGGLQWDSRFECNAFSARIAQCWSAARQLSERMENPLVLFDEYDLMFSALRRIPRGPSPAVRKFFKNLRVRSLVNTSPLPAVGSFPSERFEGVRRR
ncbi:MAG: hypothetical protein U0103_24475 [Candidatus Obscuribacterales bacterium]